jgi:hypothetical protein
VARSHRNIENILQSMGKYEEVLVQLQKALEVFVAVTGQATSLIRNSSSSNPIEGPLTRCIRICHYAST